MNSLGTNISKTIEPKIERTKSKHFASESLDVILKSNSTTDTPLVLRSMYSDYRRKSTVY